jgi:hypothetical protein
MPGRDGQGRALSKPSRGIDPATTKPSEALIMRGILFSALSNIVELGIFAAAAGALAIGMMHLR